MREETINTTALREQIEGLRHMTVGQLKNKYREVFVEESRSNHKQFLFRRVAWRIQANAEGGLSERAPPPRTGDRQRRRSSHPRAEGLPEGATGRSADRRVSRVAHGRSAAAAAGRVAGSSVPGKGHRRAGPPGRVRVRRQGPQVAERHCARRDGHQVERVLVLRAGWQTREETWRVRVTALLPSRSGARSIPGSPPKKA